MNIQITSSLVVIGLLLTAAGAWGHGDATPSPRRSETAEVVEKPFGRSALAEQATRTIRIEMSDTMRFTPALLTIKRGETVRFVVTNAGATLHEMVLGTLDELKSHAELMRKFPDMEHDEPYMAHVKPGSTGTLVWQFSQPGEFYYGCLVPGHFEAGMSGKVVVR